MMKIILSLLTSLTVLSACGSPSETGDYTCISSPYLMDQKGQNRCFQPSPIRYDSLMFAEHDTIQQCEILNNDSKDCRNACAQATQCYY